MFVHHQRPPLTSVGRVIRIRFEEPRGAGAHNPIDVTLERTQSDPFVTDAALDTLVHPLFPSFKPGPEMNPDRQLAAAPKLAVDVQLFIVGHIADVGDAKAANFGEGVSRLLESPLVRKSFWNQCRE